MLSIDRDANAAAGATVRKEWNKFTQLMHLLTNKKVVCKAVCYIFIY